jgi:hypothetical protein
MIDDQGSEKAAVPSDGATTGAKGHIIEVAKSGRARCRTCNEGIQKGELRLGEEAPNVFSESGGMSYRWHHLKCGAQKKPRELKVALARYEGEIPERAELERTIAEWEEKQHAKKKATAFPYADRATTARSKCMHCHAMIEKGEARVAIERPADSYMGGSSAGYLHPRCAVAHLGTAAEELVASLRSNSVALAGAELEEVLGSVREGTPAAP